MNERFFQVFGVFGIIFATWSLVDPTFPLQLTQESHDYLISIVILLVASIILLVVGILGIYSALKKVRCAMLIVRNEKIEKMRILIGFSFTELRTSVDHCRCGGVFGHLGLHES